MCCHATGDWDICIMEIFMICIDPKIYLAHEFERDVVDGAHRIFVGGEKKFRNLCGNLR